MPQEKRLRIFAGPNGSGKTSLFHDFSNKFKSNVGYFLNADNLEKELREKGFINLAELGLNIKEKAFLKFDTESTLKKKAGEDGFIVDIQFKDNILVNIPKETNSYEAAFVASFIRNEFIKAGISFSFETVMSHSSKLKEVEQANKVGFKTYLYYVCTETPVINKERIIVRVEKGGHPVSEEKINSRYTSSLDLLSQAIGLVHRAYIFDNSGKQYKLIAEFYKGAIKKYEPRNIPKWFHVNVVQKLDF